MNITLTINSTHYQVDYQNPKPIAIPLQFNATQPNHFAAPQAIAQPLQAGEFIGDTQQGGSCNVKQIEFVPHCNGTHTESVSHIVNDSIAIGERANDCFFPSVLISVTPEKAKQTTDTYQPNLANTDQLITRKHLVEKLADYSDAQLTGLIIRTLPNQLDKQSREYNGQHEPAFFSSEAMEYINQRNVQHLLVDLPSIDKMYDDGKLNNHRQFWQVESDSKTLNPQSQTQKTITEMIFCNNAITDGFYLLNLQLTAFASDATPSRPILLPLVKS